MDVHGVCFCGETVVEVVICFTFVPGVQYYSFRFWSDFVSVKRIKLSNVWPPIRWA